MNKYYYTVNTGKGFITHVENEEAHISEYPGNIFVTANEKWAARVNAEEKTKEEAQAIVDTAITSSSDQLSDPVSIMLP